MFALENNVVRPRRKATEAWVNQHQQQQQQRNSIFNVLENSSYIPVYDKSHHKLHKNDFRLTDFEKKL